ncbi:MAG: transposase [Planctomycetes bacterium]|nr:transposase [Planctomycetota bacterium]
MNSPAVNINCVEDHIHILCNLSRTHSMAQVIEEIKTSSSKWIKTKGEAYRDFHWQAGYGAFSVSQSKVEAVKRYIVQQEDHHKKKTFQEEYREFLAANGIKWDERYVWD